MSEPPVSGPPVNGPPVGGASAAPSGSAEAGWPDVAGAGERVEALLRRGRNTLRLSGFRRFILRGNVVDLATGIVIGAAFTAVVNSLVKDFLTPLIGIALHGGRTCTSVTPAATPANPTPSPGVVCTNGSSFADHYFSVHGSRFYWGDFVNNLIVLVLIGLALYYFVVIPVNSLMERFRADTEPGKQTKVCPECKSSIPYDATRCAFCTVVQPPLAAAELNTG